MPLALLRWGVLVLVCLVAPLAHAAAPKARQSKAKASKLVRIKGGHLLHASAAAAFQRMSTAARGEGISLWVTSGYRSRAEQRWLYDRYRKGLGPQAARPGRSNHQRGLALDLVVGDLTTPTYEWLAGNACRFSFKRTVRSEPWHWEYRPRGTRAPAKGQDCLGRPLTAESSPELARKDPS
jgi:D-alanyl-D-alanine carboxypeptidase